MKRMNATGCQFGCSTAAHGRGTDEGEEACGGEAREAQDNDSAIAARVGQTDAVRCPRLRVVRVRGQHSPSAGGGMGNMKISNFPWVGDEPYR